jgi:hypothetical protein
VKNGKADLNKQMTYGLSEFIHRPKQESLK